MRNFELTKDALELIICAEKFDNYRNNSRCIIGNISADRLYQTAERGYLFEKVVEYVEKNPRCRCKEITKSIPLYCLDLKANNTCRYTNQKISSVVNKLVKAGVLKKDIEEVAVLVPVYHCGTAIRNEAVVAKQAYFSIA